MIIVVDILLWVVCVVSALLGTIAFFASIDEADPLFTFSALAVMVSALLIMRWMVLS